MYIGIVFNCQYALMDYRTVQLSIFGDPFMTV